MTQLSLIATSATRIVNVREPGWKEHPLFVYCGRKRGHDPRSIEPGELGSFGNPWDVRVYGKDALTIFEKYASDRFATEPRFRDAVLALRGKLLGCYCVKPNGSGACHVRTYLRLLGEAS